MRLDEFDYRLPEELIALRPARPRPSSRLLVATPATLSDATVARLPDFLEPGDLLVLNDTRVIPARLARPRRRASGAEAPHRGHPDRRRPGRHLARPRPPAKRLAPGDVIRFGDALGAEVLARDGGEVTLAFDPGTATLERALEAVGEMPLPPYIAARRAPGRRRPQRLPDRLRRPARRGRGPDRLAPLRRRPPLRPRAGGVRQARLTLHVGAGTFLPVKVEDIETHRMHAEWGEIGPAAVEAVRATRAAGGRVIPVGTTALRLLEAAAGPDQAPRALLAARPTSSSAPATASASPTA